MKFVQAKWLPAAMFIVFGLAVVYGVFRSLDPDFGWHLRNGQYVLDHGVPSHDIFSYTAANYPWVNHEWLNDVFMALVYNVGGYVTLGWIYGGLWALAYAIAVGGRAQLLVMGISYAAFAPYFGVRSVVWSVLGLAVTLWFTERRQKWWLLPLIFGLWANLHGGFALGLVVLGIYAVVRRSLWLGLWTAVSLLATLLNPYGWRLYGEIWQTMTDQQLHSKIVEWWPLGIDATNAAMIVAVAVVLLSVKFDLSRRLTGGMLFFATLQANRQLSLLVLVMARPISEAIDAGFVALAKVKPVFAKVLYGGAVAGVGIIIYASLFWPVTEGTAVALSLPQASVRALIEAPCEGKLFNHYSFGGYLLWHLPKEKVYIDGRMPSWADDEGRYLDRWERVMNDPVYAEAEFSRYDVRCVLITKTDKKLGSHLEKTGWRKAVTELDAVLWRRD